MTKTKVNERKRVTIKLNSLVVNKMVQDIMKNYGQRCHVNETALNSLKEAAERFLENMWKQLREISNDNVVTIQHVHTWKRTTDFKPRFKKNNLSLCKM